MLVVAGPALDSPGPVLAACLSAGVGFYIEGLRVLADVAAPAEIIKEGIVNEIGRAHV